MRKSQLVSGLAGFALALAASHAGLGQSTEVALGSGSVTGAVVSRFDVRTGSQGAPGEPYTAVRKTTRIQRLANGTTITHENSVKEARDSSGRTYRENRPEVAAGAEGPSRDFVFVNVFDPVNRTTMNWNSRSKEVNVFHMPDPGQFRQTAPQIQADQAPEPAVRPARPQPQIENLGSKTIDGVEATGRRFTTVIPAGQAGNDQPLTITRETWFSPELKVAVLTTSDDPRNGASTSELTEIERGEPDPALFQVPEGYTVKERFAGQQP